MMEIMMGCPRDYTYGCWPTAAGRADPAGHEIACMALVGNRFNVPSAGWAIAGQLHSWAVISRMPTAAELADPGHPCNLAVCSSAGAILPREAVWQAEVAEHGEVLLARYLLSMTTHGVENWDKGVE